MRSWQAKSLLISILISPIIIYSCKTGYKKNDNVSFTVVKGNTSFDNGKNLTYSSCGCHYNKSVNAFIGNRQDDIPKAFGKVFSANITASKTHGRPAHYTDAQLAYLLKTGVMPDGHFIPYMLRPTMADADLNDIIVYLRSGDSAVAAKDTSVGKTHLTLIGKIALSTRKHQPYMPGISRPANGDAVANGRYLVDIIGCYHCHSKSLASLNYLHAEKTKRYMQGGEKFKTPTGEKIRASNLTFDKETGIGNYTQEDFRKAVKEGVDPQGDTLSLPMPRFHRLTDKQSDEIYAYLQTLPIKHSKSK